MGNVKIPFKGRTQCRALHIPFSWNSSVLFCFNQLHQPLRIWQTVNESHAWLHMFIANATGNVTTQKSGEHHLLYMETMWHLAVENCQIDLVNWQKSIHTNGKDIGYIFKQTELAFLISKNFQLRGTPAKFRRIPLLGTSQHGLTSRISAGKKKVNGWEPPKRCWGVYPIAPENRPNLLAPKKDQESSRYLKDPELESVDF